MNLYAYVGNDPVNMIDPTGMYGKGSGWSNKQWKKFDKAQKQAASDMSESAASMRQEAAGMEDGATNADGYSSSELNTMADSLDKGAAALNDDGSGGFVANAVSTGSIGGDFGKGEVGGNQIWIATDHHDFGSSRFLPLVGHEALHNAGLEDQTHNGIVAYRWTNMPKYNYHKLEKSKRHKNPDHVMRIVYP